MAEYIECRNCSSPSCKGCNMYILSTMLKNGKFDCLMNGNRTIVQRVEVAPVVRCKDCIRRHDPNECPMCFLIGGESADYTADDGYCDRGERRTGNG